MTLRRLPAEEYRVGWTCALPVERAAAEEMLDEEHESFEADETDDNSYTLRSIGGHNVAIVCLPAGRIGNDPAAAVATRMTATFKNLRFGLMVGIGGGVPTADVDIRLGDVVVSQAEKTFGGVVKYDSGKATPSGFMRTGWLNSPPTILLGAVTKVRSNDDRGKSKLDEYVSMLDRLHRFAREAAGRDVLYESSYHHVGGGTCDACEKTKQVHRPNRRDDKIVTHYGKIASGNKVIRDALTRDALSSGNSGAFSASRWKQPA